MNMHLKEQDLNAIGEYVQAHLGEWLKKFQPNEWNIPLPLIERIIRIEEEIKFLREATMEGFKRNDERFEQIDKRFEQVENRFEQIDKRFEQVEKRFEQVDRKFEFLTKRIDRFMIWSLGLTITASGLIISVLK